MNVDVYFTPGELSPADVADRVVVAIDVLRATSVMAAALAAGAKAIYPVAGIEEALRLAHTFGRDEVLLCGERRCVRIDGFDLGNSPAEYTPDRVEGKVLVMSTTNGTRAVAATAGAARVLIGSVLNLTAVCAELARLSGNVVIVCSGREDGFALEDAVCAGEIATRLVESGPTQWTLNDGASAAVALARTFRLSADFFATTAAGRAIIEAGLPDDLALCATLDARPILPVFHDRQITLSGSAAPSAGSR